MIKNFLKKLMKKDSNATGDKLLNSLSSEQRKQLKDILVEEMTKDDLKRIKEKKVKKPRI